MLHAIAVIERARTEVANRVNSTLEKYPVNEESSVEKFGVNADKFGKRFGDSRNKSKSSGELCSELHLDC